VAQLGLADHLVERARPHAGGQRRTGLGPLPADGVE
jgi:hypothetical protein